MSSPIFCCNDIKPYRPQYLDHETKFTSFKQWAAFPTKSSPATPNVNTGGSNINNMAAPFAVQLVQQVNYGPLMSKRYFIPRKDDSN